MAMERGRLPHLPPLIRIQEKHRESRWPSIRGDVLDREIVELMGGFPGSAAFANRLRRARLTIHDRWLVVNDGKSDGFAIALDAIDSLTMVPGSARARYAIHIRYREGDTTRGFYLRCNDAVWPFKSGATAVRLGTQLTTLGVPVVPLDPFSGTTSLAITEQEMRLCALETMIWSGKATAPIGGWLGQHRERSQIWLTSNSLIWRRDEASGINRIHLHDIVQGSTGTFLQGGPHPVVLIAVLDEHGDRHELPFVFDAERLPEDNRALCSAFLGGLRTRNVPVSAQIPPLRPWEDISALLRAADAGSTRPAPVSDRISAGEFEAHCLIEIARLTRDIQGEGTDFRMSAVRYVSHAAALMELERKWELGELTEREMLRQRARFTALVEAKGKLAAIAQQKRLGTRPIQVLQQQREMVLHELHQVIGFDKSPPPMNVHVLQPKMHLRLL